MVCLFPKSLPDLCRGDWLQTTPGKIAKSCKAKSPLNLLLFSGTSLQYCWLFASFILIYSIGKLKACGPHFSPIGIWNGQQLYLLWVHAQSSPLCLTLCYPMGCSLPGFCLTGFSRQEYWSGSPCPPPRDLAKLGGNCVFMSPLVGSLPLLFPCILGDWDGKAFACNAEDLGLIPGFGRSPGEGNGSLSTTLA